LKNKPKTSQLRLRIFAGPNGSGKSTVITAVSNFKTEDGHKIDLGYYINADDIAVALTRVTFTFGSYDLSPSKESITEFAATSGLLNRPEFTPNMLDACFTMKGKKIIMDDPAAKDFLAQILARYLRNALLQARKRFSFETVFSHESNLDIMREATEAGYKVYLYFVSTASPEINKFRVHNRVKQNGHAVPDNLIVSRYYRAMRLMKEAAQIAHQAFFFDNSQNDAPYILAAHFKQIGGKKKWDKIKPKDIPGWFKKYYGKKD
jgi:predicted ABC-type ATPase